MSSTPRPSQALIVCVSQYLYAGKLRASKDAKGVRYVLSNPKYCGYPSDRVVTLEEGEATRENILRALQHLCDNATTEDSRTFFYFSGHGGQSPDGVSYVLPVDARSGQYPHTAISAYELSDLFDRCRGELTVVLDCCRAAAMTRPDVGASAGPTNSDDGGESGGESGLSEFTDSLRSAIRSRQPAANRTTRRVLLAASRALGKAFMSPDAPYSIFTGHMLDCLRGAEAEITGGANVNVQQLYSYVEKRVRHDSGNSQRPLFIAETESFYDVTDYPAPLPPNGSFKKDVFISYHHDDDDLDDWVMNIFQPELMHHKLSIWDSDDVGARKLDVRDAIAKSAYTIVILTREYCKHRLEEFSAGMAVLQAIETGSRRFIPVLREQFFLPLDIGAFVPVDMTLRNEMRFRKNMDRLIRRLKKPPDEI